MIGLRGFGSVDLGPLGSAMFNGQLKPSFDPTQNFQPSYTPQGVTEPLPTWLYASNPFAAQLASLLDGSVVYNPPPGNYQGTGIPLARYVQLADGSLVLPGDVFQPGTVLSFSDECLAENYLAASIPGGRLSATCAAGSTGEIPSMIGEAPPQAVAPPAASTPIVSAPVPVVTPVSLPPSQSAGSVPMISPTVGSSTPPPSTIPPSSNNAPAAASGCFNPLSQWLSMDACLGPLGIVEWGVIAATAFLLFGGKR